MMHRNVGGTDQTVRFLGGIALLTLIVLLDGAWRWIGLFGLVPLITATVGWCPLYQLAGMNTCPKENKHV